MTETAIQTEIESEVRAFEIEGHEDLEATAWRADVAAWRAAREELQRRAEGLKAFAPASEELQE